MRLLALLHREERRPELFVVQGPQVLELGRELCEVLVADCVLSTDAFVRIVSE